LRNPDNRLGVRPAHRCARCRLLSPDCLCALVPRVETRTRVVVVMHQLEDWKPSNTGRLAVACLPNSALVVRGDERRTFEMGGERASPPFGEPPPVPTEPMRWDEHGDPVLLFPHEDARPLDDWRAHPRPVTLVVPDGTWRQGQRVRRRMPGLAGVPCALITRAAPSAYRLRTTTDPKRLATMEAIAEALAILEPDGDAVRRALLDIFDVMVARALKNRTHR